MTDTVATAANLPEDAQRALQRLIVSLADTKRLLGIRYSDWLLGAPSIESGIAASSMTQDEWGHARLLYAMLKDFGVDPVETEHDRPAGEYCSAACLDGQFADWAAVIAGIVVVDGTLSMALEGFAAGRYEPARSRVPKMLAEEEFHRDLGLAWIRQLSGGNDEARRLLRTAVESMLPDAVTCLLPVDESAQLLARHGLVADPAKARLQLARRLEGALAGFDIAALADPALPDDWTIERSRPSGAPDDDAIERARGDRNRELFVE